MVQREHPPSFSSDPPEARRVGPAEAEALAQHFVNGGAILTPSGCPVARFLVGHLALLDPQRIFWFTAYGDSTADGHVLEFDDARLAEPGGLTFLKDGRVAGCLSPIAQAGVDDPDDYRIAWQLWQEVAPLRGRLIANSRALAVGQVEAFAVDSNRSA